MRIPLTSYGLSVILAGSVLLLGGVVAAAFAFWPAAPVLGLLWLGLLAFFRDPERRAECGADDLLSAADGIVRDVEDVRAPAFLEGRCRRIGVFMSVLDVHVNRSPANGVVRWVSHHPGSFRDARSETAKLANEHNFVGLELEGGRKVLVNQIAGLLARRIVCAACEGDRLARGQRFGMVRFGSRVEIYLPLADRYEVRVRPGDPVWSGRTVIARWIGRANASPPSA